MIGIGSANRYNESNPFALEETIEMLELVLGEYEGYKLIPIDDLDDGPRWLKIVAGMFGPLDAFVTANPYVTILMSETYRILRPVDLVPQSERIAVDGTSVRMAMARGEDWADLVPSEVADYIKTRNLDERFRREFGLETLKLNTIVT